MKFFFEGSGECGGRREGRDSWEALNGGCMPVLFLFLWLLRWLLRSHARELWLWVAAVPSVRRRKH